MVIGCARLPETQAEVEFSANGEEFRGSLDTCINPAYEEGNYIPATCTTEPLDQLRVLEGGRRREADSPDGYVFWGTAPADSQVVVETSSGRIPAATFQVPGEIASRVGASAPFTVFLGELPVEAACDEVRVETKDGQSEKVPGGRNVCPATTGPPPA